MFQSDYILRVIEQLGVLVQRMLDALREARPEEALRLSEEALGLGLGLDADVALALTGEGLLSFMGAGGEVDSAQALVVGETLCVRSRAWALAGDSQRQRIEAERARVVLETVQARGTGEQSAHAAELLVALDDAQ